MISELFKKSAKVGIFLLIAGALILAGCQKKEGEEAETKDAEKQAQMQSQEGIGKTTTPELEVSDEELQTFNDILTSTQEVQRDATQKMRGAVTATGMSLQRYSEIAQQMQAQQGQGQPGQNEPVMTEEEQQQMQEAQQSLHEIQAEMQRDIYASIEEGGMEPQRFETIFQALRSDQALQQRFQKLHQPQQQGQPQ